MSAMARKLFIVLIVAFVSIPSSAQWYAGGYLAGSASELDAEKSWSYCISPEVGRIFKDKMAVGLRASYGKSYMHSETHESDPEHENIYKKTKYGTTPFSMRTYFAYRAVDFGKMSLWAEAGAFIVPEQDGNSSTQIGLNLVPVLTYQLSPRFLLRTSLDFVSVSMSTDIDMRNTIKAVVDLDDVISVPDLSIGAVYLC